MHRKVSSSLDFVSREKRIERFWKENKIFEKSVALREGAPQFVFFDGPPTANGTPHIGHVLTRSVKDLIPRYKTMKGFSVPRKAGWDTHGLPVELEVEKLLGLDGKQDIEKYGIIPFNEKCKESVWKYTGEWRGMSDQVAYWCDMDHPYVTYHNDYIESVWWAIKQISDKGLLYKGHKIVPYCPRCGTSLSSHEVDQGYKDVKETSIFVKFRVKGEEDKFFLAWTTTPWTLPSNVALAVNASEDYVEARAGGETLVMAKALAEGLLGEYEELSVKKGAELAGTEYEPLYSFEPLEKKAHFVVTGDFVTLTDGSGIVHIAPAFGEDDAQVGRENDLPFVQAVNSEGKFKETVAPWAGVFVKDADKGIIADLSARGLLFKEVDFEHSYPFCWRCDTPLLYYAMDTWFIKMTAVKDELIENNRSVNWMPENIKEGRMGNFLNNVVDWALSRSRYWGTPLPVWECECGHFHTVGSIEELKKLGGDVQGDIELHRPYVDGITIKCEKCGGEMRRTPEVIDCWFDSGSMPFAQLHYPFENRELFENSFPADFISEAIDQTRGWFYSLLAISTILFGRAPFKNCIVLGHVGDKNGVKMSKHVGNVIAPQTVLNKQGADAVRWYFYSNSALWLPSRFYEEAVDESQRKFMGTLWNTLSFYVLYANIDGFDATAHSLDAASLSIMDKWVLSKLNTLVAGVDAQLENYQITESSRAIAAFVEDLSNWYVRRGRERYWGPEMTGDKINAYMTLYTVLVTLSKLIAPFVPFLAEEMYQTLVRDLDPAAPESVHLCDFPGMVEGVSDAGLEVGMDTVLRIVNMGRACRSAANIKIRQPLARLYVRSASGESLKREYAEIAEEELNIKEILFTDSVEGFVSYKFKPQLRTLGKKLGKLLPEVGRLLSELDGQSAMAELNEKGTLTLEAGGQSIALDREDLLIESVKSGEFISESDGEMTVVLDTALNEALIEEGLVREVVNKLQTTRKEAGLDVVDHIKIFWETEDGALASVMEKFAAEISADTLADMVARGSGGAFRKDWSINGIDATFGVEKI